MQPSRCSGSIRFLQIAVAINLMALHVPTSAGDATGHLPGFGPDAHKRQQQVEDRFLRLPEASVYRAHLERLTRDPHPSGSAANYALADYLAQVMGDAGLEVERHEYDAWMPHHLPQSRVALVTPIRLPLNDQEYILAEDPFSSHPQLTPGWNAYSGSGDVTGTVVYVNYGRREDY